MPHMLSKYILRSFNSISICPEPLKYLRTHLYEPNLWYCYYIEHTVSEKVLRTHARILSATTKYASYKSCYHS